MEATKLEVNNDIWRAILDTHLSFWKITEYNYGKETTCCVLSIT